MGPFDPRPGPVRFPVGSEYRHWRVHLDRGSALGLLFGLSSSHPSLGLYSHLIEQLTHLV